MWRLCNLQMRETWVRSLGWEDPLEKGMAAHSSILAWRIPRTEEPEGLQSTGSQSQARLTLTHTHTHNFTKSSNSKDSRVCVPQQPVSSSYTLFGGGGAVLGLPCCTQAFSSWSEWRLLFAAVRGLLIAVASLVAKHGI